MTIFLHNNQSSGTYVHRMCFVVRTFMTTQVPRWWFQEKFSCYIWVNLIKDLIGVW